MRICQNYRHILLPELPDLSHERISTGSFISTERLMIRVTARKGAVLTFFPADLSCWCGYPHDGKGRWVDNVMIERVWRSVKWECLYLREVGGSQALKILRDWFRFYNEQRPHTAFDGHRPIEVYCKKGIRPQRRQKTNRARA